MHKLKPFPLSVIALTLSTSVNAASWPERSTIQFWADRANEDWSYVDHLDESDKSFAEKLKRICINDQWKVSFSANLKADLENIWNHDFDPSNRQVNQLNTRLYLSTDVTYQDWARFFGELRVNYSNRAPLFSYDDGGTDFHQLFAEFQLVETDNHRLSAKTGRQEMVLNNWQMSNREPTPVQRSWDAIKANYQIGDVSFDLYWGEEVGQVKGAGANFDDRGNGNKSAGLYASWDTDYGTMKAYLMDSKVKNTSFIHAPNGTANIQTIGLSASHFAREVES